MKDRYSIRSTDQANPKIANMHRQIGKLILSNGRKICMTTLTTPHLTLIRKMYGNKTQKRQGNTMITFNDFPSDKINECANLFNEQLTDKCKHLEANLRKTPQMAHDLKAEHKTAFTAEQMVSFQNNEDIFKAKKPDGFLSLILKHT